MEASAGSAFRWDTSFCFIEAGCALGGRVSQMKDVSMPDSFVALCQHFNQDVTVLYPSVQKAISTFAGYLTVEQRYELHLYLQTLITSDMSDDAIAEIWRKCGAGVYVTPMRPFFSSIDSVLSTF